ncbi:alpha/beta hydrolase fold domain-containing protein [uncultured Microbacterium sp.]|uniref:alpha/beta hydrolase fold domain-containing protein n=1 Tax=uncultured Microbacterium sp. TaxID=191216 RepID=UPI0025F1FFDB|nr:alpha/beta hydrolase fold domain-containing protein [uncultured Microbacterium sp.]
MTPKRQRAGAFRAPRLDPFVARVEAELAPLRVPEPRSAAGRRAAALASDEAIFAATGRVRPDVATSEYRVDVAGHPAVRVRVYWPTPMRPDPADPARAVLVYNYGGAFTLGGIDWPSWDATFAERAVAADVIVVAVDYAHAPEQRFPTQPEQCWAAFEWVIANAADLGADPARLVVGGASSGANLAAAVTLMNRDRSRHPIALQLLENPVFDLTMGHADLSGMRGVPGAILRRLGRRLVRQYVGRGSRTARNPYASPLLAESLAELPPAVIYTSELDPLRGDGEAYARALTASGVPAVALRVIGATHTSLGMTGPVFAADHIARDLIETLRSV